MIVTMIIGILLIVHKDSIVDGGTPIVPKGKSDLNLTIYRIYINIFVAVI